MANQAYDTWNGAFVVGTGRCGSTLLSDALALHSDVLSLSELLAGLGPAAFPEGTISGQEFWALLTSRAGLASRLLRIHAEPSEVLYPVDGGRRFDRASGVPSISITTRKPFPGSRTSR